MEFVPLKELYQQSNVNLWKIWNQAHKTLERYPESGLAKQSFMQVDGEISRRLRNYGSGSLGLEELRRAS